jgi:hypothetical protein
MKENLWSRTYTVSVIWEYHRFIMLAQKYSVAPSYEIDQVWHLHMLHTKDYINSCKIYGEFVHHNPTSSEEKRVRTRDPYEDTKIFYMRMFGENPPEDIWTDWFERENVYVDSKKYHIIPKDNVIKFLFNLIKSRLWD